MFINILITTVIILAIIFIALGIKMWFKKDAEFTGHSCALGSGQTDNSACPRCQLTNLEDSPEGDRVASQKRRKKSK